MKKFLTMAAIALFTLASCSEDDAAPTNPGENPSETVLLKKVIETDDLGTYTSLYNYDGTKLTSVTYSDGSRDEYTYEFQYITKIETFDENNLSIAHYNFTYDIFTTKIVSASQTFDGFTTTTDFTHNADGTVSYTRGEGFQHGTIYPTKFSQYTDTGFSQILLWHNFEFDSKKDPMLNVMGMDKMVIADYCPTLFGHNVTNYNTTREDGQFNQQLQISTYTYNAQGYPVTEHRIEDETDVTEVQYFYE